MSKLPPLDALSLVLIVHLALAGPAAAAPHEPTGSLTLPQALELALAHNPALTAAAHDTRAADEEARQAGAVPNPELELETGEFGGTGQRRGFGTAETTLLLSQPIELGGKRHHRERAARAQARLAAWDYATARLDVVARTRLAFLDVLVAQERQTLAEGAADLAAAMCRAAAARVDAGKVPEIEKTRAAVEATAAAIAREAAGRELEVARGRLAATWGSNTACFARAAGSLEPAPEATEGGTSDRNPEVARWADELTAAEAALALARAQRVPDATVRVGVSHFAEDDAVAAVAGLSLPLPVFDRQAGGMAAAQQRLLAAGERQHGARLTAATVLAEAHGRLSSARAEAQACRASLLPAAETAFAATEDGYRQGKFGLLDVLDAARVLNQARATHLDALAACHRTAVEIDRLTGHPPATAP